MDVGVAHLIQADIPPERVLNFWDLATLEDWLARKQVRGPAAATPAPLTSLNL